MKGLAPDLQIAYNSGVQTRYTQGLAAANSWNAQAWAGLSRFARRSPRRFESMTYIVYRVLRRMPRPVLVALLVVMMMTALARA